MFLPIVFHFKLDISAKKVLLLMIGKPGEGLEQSLYAMR